MNKYIGIGRITRDVELRYTPSGSAVAKTGFAVNRTWKDKTTGEKKDETMFIDIVIYGKSAEIANQYIEKGKQILVEGRLVLEQWTTQSGEKRSKHVLSVESFQLLGKKETDTPKDDTEYSNVDLRTPEIEIDGSEIPF